MLYVSQGRWIYSARMVCEERECRGDTGAKALVEYLGIDMHRQSAGILSWIPRRVLRPKVIENERTRALVPQPPMTRVFPRSASKADATVGFHTHSAQPFDSILLSPQRTTS